jgi:TatD DNase family protein
LLLETDSPVLTPEPHRGRRNEPSYLPYIAARIAAVRGMSVDALASATTANARRIFRVDQT